MPHFIRLREPWSCVEQSDSADTPLTFERAFNCPTGLEPGQQTAIRIVPKSEQLPCCAQLNETTLELTPDDEAWLADISSAIQPHNRLRLSFTGTAHPSPSMSNLADVSLRLS